MVSPILTDKKPKDKDASWLTQGQWDYKLQLWNRNRDSSVPKVPGDFF